MATAYEKFVEMIDQYWDGIASYCKLVNKLSFGFVEGRGRTKERDGD